ncbi:MCP four helix bundle domain-containing protein [Methylovorus mays]|uniref:MCP four helix bundle domain-containing protein n=1 Tax=Methylovorus mays TaxID=184077 RepID=UPI001E5465FA|nr:MCP four helix bundle domain-containing protein [Methylovorus mays]
MKLTVAKKMIVLLSIAILGLIILAVSGQYYINQVFEKTNYVTINTVPSIVILDDVSKAYSDMQETVYQHIINTDDSVMTQLDKTILEHRAKMNEGLDTYEKKQYHRCQRCFADQGYSRHPERIRHDQRAASWLVAGQ